MSLMQIIDLQQVPHYLPTLAQWHHQQWSYLNPGQSLQQRREKMQAYLQASVVPSTLVATDNDKLLGSASLVVNDMDNHPEWMPWLASVFVLPEFRGRGLGSALVEAVMKLAADHGLSTLYLFTPDQMEFYRRLGWSIVTKENYRGHLVSVMQVGLRD